MTGGSFRSLKTRPRRVTILIFAKENFKEKRKRVIGCIYRDQRTSRVRNLTENKILQSRALKSEKLRLSREDGI